MIVRSMSNEYIYLDSEYVPGLIEKYGQDHVDGVYQTLLTHRDSSDNDVIDIEGVRIWVDSLVDEEDDQLDTVDKVRAASECLLEMCDCHAEDDDLIK